MKLYCPYCTSEITPETSQCLSCGTVYGPDTLELVRIIFEKGDQRYENERRRQIRLSKVFKASYLTPKDFAESYIHGLSLGGVFVETNDPLDPGEQFILKVSLPDQEDELEVRCEVIWSREEEQGTPTEKLPPGMGVKFLNLSKENIERLINILDRSLT